MTRDAIALSHSRNAAQDFVAGLKQNRRPLGRLFLHSGNVDVQSQFLNFQDLSFHGVNVSSRHVSNRWDR